jgi:hypothetical protein
MSQVGSLEVVSPFRPTSKEKRNTAITEIVFVVLAIVSIIVFCMRNVIFPMYYIYNDEFYTTTVSTGLLVRDLVCGFLMVFFTLGSIGMIGLRVLGSWIEDIRSAK